MLLVFNLAKGRLIVLVRYMRPQGRWCFSVAPLSYSIQNIFFLKKPPLWNALITCFSLFILASVLEKVLQIQVFNNIFGCYWY